MKKVLVGLVVLLAVIVPSQTASANDLGKFIDIVRVVATATGNEKMGAVCDIADGLFVPVSAKEALLVGNQIDEGLVKEYGTTTDGLVRVQTIVAQLTKNLDEKPDVKVLDTSEKQAFAVPGHIYITDGLLKDYSADSTVAGVLGHEVAHINLGHTKAAIQQHKYVNVGFGVLRLAGARKNLRDGVTIAAVIALLKCSRDNEYAADKRGIELAHEAGYDSMGLANALTKLGAGSKKSVEFLSTHPDMKKRIAKATTLAEDWGSVGGVELPKEKTQTKPESRPTSRPTSRPLPVEEKAGQVSFKAPKFYGAISVIPRNEARGGYGFFEGSSEEAIRILMEDELVRSGRYTIADREGREETWGEQDMGDTGRMDNSTVPSKQKTVAARAFLYVTLTNARTTQQAEASFGNWSNSADVRLVKAELKGKIALKMVETSTIVYSGEFAGKEIGYDTEARVSNNWSSGANARWSSRPAGKAAQEACRKAVEELIQYMDRNMSEFVVATGKCRLITENGGAIGITVTSGKYIEVGDYVVFYRNDNESAKYKVLAIDGQDCHVQTILEQVRPTTEPFKIF